jgi:hypothetical protein
MHIRKLDEIFNYYTLDEAIDLCKLLKRFCNLKISLRNFIPIFQYQKLYDLSTFAENEFDSMIADFIRAKNFGHKYVCDIPGYLFWGV